MSTEKKLPSTAWKKGQSGNPKGAPEKTDSVSFLMRKYLNKKADKEKSKINKQIFVERVFAKAMAGDIAAMKLVWNYMDGMPPQTFLGTGDKGEIIIKWQK